MKNPFSFVTNCAFSVFYQTWWWRLCRVLFAFLSGHRRELPKLYFSGGARSGTHHDSEVGMTRRNRNQVGDILSVYSSWLLNPSSLRIYGARTIPKNRMEGSVTCLYGFLDAMMILNVETASFRRMRSSSRWPRAGSRPLWLSRRLLRYFHGLCKANAQASIAT
jgi:hypothetical protein